MKIAQDKAIPSHALIYVAGHQGLVGSAMWRRLERAGYKNLVGTSSGELDLRDRSSVDRFFKDVAPDLVILAAARVGGIVANASRPADFLEDNLRIQVNVMDAARRAEFSVYCSSGQAVSTRSLRSSQSSSRVS